MSIDTKLELAKREYVNAINEINNKYELPLCLVEIILSGIIQEVTSMKNSKIAEEMQEINSEKGEDENEQERERVEEQDKEDC